MLSRLNRVCYLCKNPCMGFTCRNCVMGSQGAKKAASQALSKYKSTHKHWLKKMEAL